VLDTDRCFATALEAVLTRTAEGTHLRPQLQVRGAPYRIDPAWEQALVRITQESLTNTLKYAKASQFEVELRYNPRETRLRLHDDGIGFDYQPGGGSAGDPTVARASGVSGGLGLLGIEERCRQLGGRVQIASSATEGTTLEIIIPRRGLFWGCFTFLWPLR
jgi:signal transduction histidine kinase